MTDDWLKHFVIVKEYYCDAGTRAGKHRVEMVGYLTPEELAEFLDLDRRGPAS